MLAFHSRSNRELPDIRSGLPCSGARVKTSSTTTPGTPSEPPPSRDSRSICDGWRPKPRHDRRPRVPAHRLRVRTSPPNRSNCPRWRASERITALGCSRAIPSRCVLRSVTHCGPTSSRTPTRATSGRLLECLPQAGSSLRGAPHGVAGPHKFSVNLTCARAYLDATHGELHLWTMSRTWS